MIEAGAGCADVVVAVTVDEVVVVVSAWQCRWPSWQEPQVVPPRPPVVAAGSFFAY